MEKQAYIPKGICSKKIEYMTEQGKVKEVIFHGGCNGNGKGLANLVAGMEIEEAISRLEGVTCGSKKTSCPDQLAQALKKSL